MPIQRSIISHDISSSSLTIHNRPRRRPRKLSVRTINPSAGLLSLLATVAASSTGAHGRPLIFQRTPPPFLCPSVDCELLDLINRSPHSPPQPTTTASDWKPRRRPRPLRKGRTIPVKFERKPDNLWHRVDEYTLYGSTMCRDGCLLSSSTTRAVDDTVDPTSSFNLSASATTTVDILSSLPKGWNSGKAVTQGRTTLILALALVLAFSICGAMLAFIFWRKKRSRKASEYQDVEGRARKKRRDLHDTGQSQRYKESRVKQKIWVKATARWKANVRYSARQRRGKRLVNNQATGTPRRNSHDELAIASRSVSPSRRTPAPRPSLIPPAPSTPIAPSNASQSSLSPPNYHSHPPRLQDRTPSSFIESQGNQTADPVSNQLACSTGHVAIDEKAALARLNDLASAPPSFENNVVNGSEDEVSAPFWEDEDPSSFEDLPFDSRTSGKSTLPFSLLFPPPPSPPPAEMESILYGDYLHSFPECEASEAEGGVSAPPFEDAFGDSPLAPSAPPLADENTLEIAASAPSLEDDLETP